MPRIANPAEFSALKQELINRKLKKASGEEQSPVIIRIAMATCGIASGAKEVMDFMSAAMRKRGIHAEVIPTGCLGYCYAEPTVEVTLPGKEPVVFGYVDIDKADLIIESYIKLHEPVGEIIEKNFRTIDE